LLYLSILELVAPNSSVNKPTVTFIVQATYEEYASDYLRQIATEMK